MSNLTKDSLAILLICSNLGLNLKDEDSVKPYTLNQWNKLTERLINSSMKRPEAFFETDEEMWRKDLFLTDEEIARLKKLLARAGQVGIEIEHLENLGIYITTRAEKNYPKRLKEILKKSSPLILFYSGNMTLVETKGVAVVGSRNIDEGGLNFTKKLAARCAREGLTIISGGARGVDTIAQNIALEEGGKVISILSDSLARKIKYKEIRESIMKGNLLLLSSVNPKAGFAVYSAMERNKYIYALSNFAVVVSSDNNKGGTWAGATENLKNKWVPLFVRQDDVIPKGNSKLLSMGAKPIFTETIEDRSIDIYDWLKKNQNVLNDKAEYTQLNMESLLSCKKEDEVDIDKKVEDEVKIDKEDSNLDNIDVYSIVWPYIKKALSEPKSQTELCELLDVRKVQLNDWLKRAINEKKVKKLSNPVRYTLI